LLLKTGQKGSETDRTKNVCPICHIRIELKKERVCQTCQDRRLLTAKQLRKDRKIQVSPETPFLGEIADGNGRVALIAARIGLKHWLTGEMVRTTFVTEANGLEAELKAMEAYPAKDFEQDEREVIQEIKGLYPDGWNKYNSTRIAKEIEEGFRVKSDMTNPALAKATYFLYGYRTPNDKLNRSPELSDNYWMDADVNLKIAKTPTASRLLNSRASRIAKTAGRSTMRFPRGRDKYIRPMKSPRSFMSISPTTASLNRGLSSLQLSEKRQTE
jgi:hypothetical protein